MTKKQTQTPKPADTLRDGAIKATIWRNESEKDGKTNVFFTADISRTYTDADGKYQDSHSFSGIDLLKVARLSGKAYDRLAKLRKAEAALVDDDDEGGQ